MWWKERLGSTRIARGIVPNKKYSTASVQQVNGPVQLAAMLQQPLAIEDHATHATGVMHFSTATME